MDQNSSCPFREEPEGNGLTRRHFLRGVWWGSIGLLGLTTAAGLIASLKPRIAEGSFGSKITIATVDEIRAMPVGTVAYYIEQRVYISKVEEGGFLAMYRKCTHLGCVVPWAPDDPSEDDIAARGRFHCPCHGGIYDRFGIVHAGPPPRPMDLFAVSIDGDSVIVDTGEIISRSKFEESQVTRV